MEGCFIYNACDHKLGKDFRDKEKRRQGVKIQTTKGSKRKNLKMKDKLNMYQGSGPNRILYNNTESGYESTHTL